MSEGTGERNMTERRGTKMKKRKYERKENGQNVVIKRSISGKIMYIYKRRV
jgi:hypothetical protein